VQRTNSICRIGGSSARITASATERERQLARLRAARPGLTDAPGAEESLNVQEEAGVDAAIS
jgi:hypothetical protein